MGKKVTFFELLSLIAAVFFGCFELLFFISWAIGYMSPVVSAIIIYLGILSVIVVTARKKLTDWIVPVVVFISLSIFFGLIFRLMFFAENGNLYAGWTTVWGDWAIHLSYATGFAFGNNFPPRLPVFAGNVLSYPFLADFVSAVLLSLKVPVTYSFTVPSALMTVTALTLLAGLYKEITGRWLTAITAVVIFIFNGGLGLWYVYKNLPLTGIEWKSIITTIIIPQRGFVFGLALSLIVFGMLLKIYRGGAKAPAFLYAGLLTGMLPLWHLHSFLVVNFVAGLVFLARIRDIKKWFLYALPVLILAVPVIYYFFLGGNLGSSIRFHPGWMAKTLYELPVFWLKNLGIMIVLPFLGIFTAKWEAKKIIIIFYLIFIAANLFIFQPWDWDNTKMFAYWYIGAALGAAVFINQFRKYGSVILLILCVASGVFDAGQLFKIKEHKQLFYSKEQIAMAEFVKNKTPPKSVFLAADNHDNPVINLAGRQSMLTFPGWLWTYGVNYFERKNDIETIKKGGPGSLKLLQKYHVDYLFIGPSEIAQGFNKDFFAANYATIYDSDGYIIFAIM